MEAARESTTVLGTGVATDNEIRLTPERYYPADGSALFLRGYYPPAPLEADGSLTYRLTGEEDLMLTGNSPVRCRHLSVRRKNNR